MKNLYLTSWGGCASHMLGGILCGYTHLQYPDIYPRDSKSWVNKFTVFRTHWPEIPIIPSWSYTPSKARDSFQNHYYDTNSVPKIDKNTAVVYLYGNPFNSLLSFYRRNRDTERKISILHADGGKEEPCKWVKKTCYWLRGNYKDVNDDWNIDGYLDNGEDLFKWEENFDKWLNSETDYPILFIRSEDIWEKWDEIVWHLFGKNNLKDDENNLKDDGTKHMKLPEKIQRKSDWTGLSEETKTKLFNVYGNLYDKVNNLPPVFLKEKK
jgi:hypothetical protein